MVASKLKSESGASLRQFFASVPIPLWAIVGFCIGFPASAENLPKEFRGADLVLGAKLMAKHQCFACHQRKVGGDGTAIYRPQGRISTAGFLRGMVEQCNTELNLGLFPEEVTAIAAVLNRDHYKFR